MAGEKPAKIVTLKSRSSIFEAWLKDLIKARLSPSVPPLLLNDHCSVCEFSIRCHEQAIQEGNFSLLRGMTENEIAKYNSKGLFNITQLSYTFRSRRPPKRSKKQSSPHYFSLQAQAIRENKIFIHGPSDFDIPRPRIYFDIEGGPNNGSYYLIGALMMNGEESQYHSFWADDDDSKVEIFSRFLDFVSSYPDAALLHYGSYEADAFKSIRGLMSERHATHLTEAAARSVNILSRIRSRVYFPTFSNGLKDVATHLGAVWSQTNASGLQSLVWRYRWLMSREPIWKELLLQYNREDCEALQRVAQFLDIVTLGASRGAMSEAPALAFTDSLAKSETRRPIFKKPEFALADFTRINQCAYFDYQRDRVAARLPGLRKPRKVLAGKARAVKTKLSKTVEIISKRCQKCHSKQVKPSRRTLTRTVIDLKFQSVGVKRWVVRHVCAMYRCTKCGHHYIPDGFPVSWSKFGWALKVWCIYNHFISGQNLSRIRAGLWELFKLDIPQSEVYRFKTYVADCCRPFCRDIFVRLMSSACLYIDETQVKLRSQKGYVWVITNGECAYYFYRSSREGAFLIDLLKCYSGVLVTDFFTAYDSINVPQQRCLIHLMRDINEEMLRHPYDEELKSLGCRFSELLSSIVATIDDHGLKRRHLIKHQPKSVKFLEWVASIKSTSKSTVKLQSRLIKYRHMLFTFLERDNVAWNNNNAERAMKSFARYRRFSDGKFTARSLQEYLSILSVCQTCEFLDENFLEMLLGWRDKLGFTDPRSTPCGSPCEESVPLPGYELI